LTSPGESSQRVASELVRVREGLQDIYEQAVATAGSAECRLRIGGHAVRLLYAGPDMWARLSPSFAHLIAADEDAAEPDLTVRIWDSASTGTRVPDSSLIPRLGQDPERPRYHSADLALDYHAYDVALSFLDRRSSEAFYCASDAALLTAHDIAYPLTTILNWWMGARGLYCVHAAAVGTEGRGALITGASGSGKSTTAMLCWGAGLQYAGDDYVLFGVEPPYAHSLYSSGRFDRRLLSTAAELFPAQGDRTPGDGKALVSAFELAPSRMPSGLPIDAILIPRISPGSATSVVPATRSAALLALAPTTVLNLPGGGPGAFRAIARLAERVPTLWLQLGSDLAGVAPVVMRALQGCAPLP